METKWIENTVQDFDKIEKRANNALKELDRLIPLLERSADASWENPNAEENNEKYLDLLTKSERQKELLCELTASISNSKRILNLLIECNL